MEKLLIEKSHAGRKGYSLPALDVPAVDMAKCLGGENLRHSEPQLPEMSENEIARHYYKLSHLNYSLEDGLYPLGSCTMKYNPKVNEVAAGLPGFQHLHPNIAPEHAQGALRLMYELGESLKEILGLQGVSLQPAAGAHGEFTGVSTIRAYHWHNKDFKRKYILLPDSAHGTNPASATIAGFTVVGVKSREDGRVDLKDLESKCNDEVAGFMLTNPNTIGLFEDQIIEIGKLIHGCGGLMYMDGANLNALMGLARPGDMGFDCIHINLHKTFSTPHGGGGPGSGPICVAEKLVPFLPVPQVIKSGENYELKTDIPTSIGRVHSFFGNFGVLVRAFIYIRMLGGKGLREASENAILNANYVFSQLKDNFEVPFNEPCLHEFVLSGEKRKHETGVSTGDFAKRLLDYGYHAPTIYFPLIVHEALLVEPTETETKESLDNFAATMNKIAQEARENPDLVRNAPHNAPTKRLNDALAARNLNISWVK